MTLVAPAPTLSPPVRVRDLTASARNHYAQALADALYRGELIPAEPRRFNEPPNFRTTGTSPAKPKLVEAFASEHQRAGIPPARILLGRTWYQNALTAMSVEQRTAWFDWVQRRRDAYGDTLPAPALFRSSGDRVIGNYAHTRPEAHEAALTLLKFAWIEGM